MQTASNWQLTFDPAGTPLVLVSFGQIMDGEFTIPWAQQVQQGGKIRSATGKRWARGNAASGISLTTYLDHATDAAARLWCLQTSIALGTYAGRTAKLRLQIQGSNLIYELADATLDRAESRMRVAGTPRTQTEWSVGGTGWSLVP